MAADPEEPHTTTRRYLGNSFVLETTHTTEEGVVRVVDAMPIDDDRADIVRRVEGVSGSVRLRHEWVVRFGYGKVRPWVHRIVDPHGHPALHAIAGPDTLVLRGDRLPTASDGRHADTFDVGAARCCPGPRRGSRAGSGFPNHWTSTTGSTPPGSAGACGRTPATATATTRPRTSARCWSCGCSPTRHRRDRRRGHDLAARGSAASATGTTGSAGCATPRSRSRRCSSRVHRGGERVAGVAAARGRRATPRTCRSCTGSTAAASSPSACSATCPATPGRARSGSATAPSTSCRPTCSAR